MIGDTFANDLLKLIFNATAIANMADNAASSPFTNLYIAFHTGEVAGGGNQTTNECAYTGCVRVPLVRTTSGWTVSGRNVVNLLAIAGGLCTGGSETITHWSVGTAISGTGKVLLCSSLAKSVQGPFTATVADVITVPGHTFSVDDRCTFYAAAGSSLPTGITSGTLYWVKTVSGDDITISATQGGAAVNITAVGDGIAYKADTLAVSNNITPEFATTQLSITL